MSVTYVAGYDGTPSSRAAVELAARLARPADAHVIAVHVYPGTTATHWVPVEAMRDVGERTEALELLGDLDGVEGVAARAIAAESPSRGLHDLAVETGASLIAVGTTHHGAIGRLAPGSVGMHLLHGAPCPVLVTPPDAADAPLRKIGVAYDGRAPSRAALESARTTAKQLGATLQVIGVMEPILTPAPAVNPRLPELIEADERLVEKALEEVAEAGSGHELLHGPPAQMLVEASADLDLLVAGSRGYGAVGGVLLGSVSRYLVDHASCPVLIVPEAA